MTKIGTHPRPVYTFTRAYGLLPPKVSGNRSVGRFAVGVGGRQRHPKKGTRPEPLAWDGQWYKSGMPNGLRTPVLALAPLLSLAHAVAANAGFRVYVTNEGAGEVAVLDGQTLEVVTRIPVGKRPRGIAVSRDGRRLYVALSGSPPAPPGVDESALPAPDRRADGIGVVDLAAGKLRRTLPSGQDPEAFDLSPDGTRLYVSNEETAEMSVLDLTRGRVIGRVRVGREPEGVAVRPDGKVVYVTCEEENVVVAVDVARLRVLGRIETGARPRAIAFTRDGATAFVTAEMGGVVNVVDARAHKVLAAIKMPPPTKIQPMGPRPMGIVLGPDGRRAYVSNGRGRSVAVIDVETREVVKVIEDVGARPWGIGTSPDGKRLFTANGPSNDVSAIDVETGAVVKRVKVGELPWGLVVRSSPPPTSTAPSGRTP